MDKVLTRKLFKKRYFRANPPKKFNNGGLSSLEKGIIAANFAAPLNLQDLQVKVLSLQQLKL